MRKNKLAVVETAVSSTKDAKNMAHSAISERLAACVHINKIKSVYRWKGKIEETAEVKLVFKTAYSRVNALCEFLSRNHPYEVPEILVFRVDRSLQNYTDWVVSETKNIKGNVV
jgi:periplasmic divalent cation tolerance protein